MQIYKITNLINNKIYIGQDAYDNKNYYGSGRIIKRAIKKYGKHNFIKDILNQCNSKQEMNELEIYWIKYFKDCGYILYNLTKGGGGSLGYRHLNESKQKMKGRKAWNKGLTKDIDNRVKKISLSMKGKIFSDSHKKKISMSKKGRNYEEKYGIYRAIEIKNKIRLKTKLTFNQKTIKEKRSKDKKGKSYEEIYKIENIERMKNMARKRMLGENNPAKRPEVREKMSKMRKGIPNKYKGTNKENNEIYRRLSDSKKGKKFTEGHKRNLSIAKKGLYTEDKSHSAKTFIFYSPCGIRNVVKGIYYKFCEENNLCGKTIREHLNKNNHNYKGWAIYRYENNR
jgi:group I intron endonuclease